MLCHSLRNTLLIALLYLMLNLDLKAKAQYMCQVTDFSNAVNDLGVNLTQGLSRDENFLVSPLGVYVALASVYLGATDNTSQQIGDVLQLPCSFMIQKEFHETIDHILYLNAPNPPRDLTLASGMFVQEQFAIHDKYRNYARNLYNTTIESVNFAGRGVAARNRINRFVATNSRNTVKASYKAQLDRSTLLALMNVVYFNSTMVVKHEVRRGNFRTGSGEYKQVKYVTVRDEYFFYFESANHGIQYLAFINHGSTMIILALPHSAEDIDSITMTSDVLCRIVNSAIYSSRKLDLVQIPAFLLKYKMELNDTLKSLGIQSLYEDDANLIRISPNGTLKASTIAQEAVMKFAEENDDGIGKSHSPTDYTKLDEEEGHYYFVADRPFSIYVIDMISSAIILSGHVTDPEEM